MVISLLSVPSSQSQPWTAQQLWRVSVGICLEDISKKQRGRELYDRRRRLADALMQEITFIGSLYLVAMCSACLVGGRPCELIGIRKTFLIGGALLVIGMFTASWCHSIGTLIVTQGNPFRRKTCRSLLTFPALGIIAGLGGGLLYTTGSACESLCL